MDSPPRPFHTFARMHTLHQQCSQNTCPSHGSGSSFLIPERTASPQASQDCSATRVKPDGNFSATAVECTKDMKSLNLSQLVPLSRTANNESVCVADGCRSGRNLVSICMEKHLSGLPPPSNKHNNSRVRRSYSLDLSNQLL